MSDRIHPPTSKALNSFMIQKRDIFRLRVCENKKQVIRSLGNQGAVLILSEITDSEREALLSLVAKAIAVSQGFRFGDICPVSWAKAYPESPSAAYVRNAEAAIAAVRKFSVSVNMAYAEYQALLSFVAKAIALSQNFRFGDVCPIVYSRVFPQAKSYVVMAEAAIAAMRKFGVT